MKYKKKPVVIEAVQWTGLNHEEVRAFCPTAQFAYSDAACEVGAGPVVTLLTIPTLEGDHRASYGDYIIKGVNGEFYPCKPDILKATYEAVE